LRLRGFAREIFSLLCEAFLGRTDNIAIRFAAVALLFNVVMVVSAIIAIAMTIPKDDPKETWDWTSPQ
jgi:hypothetical protein